MAEAKWDKQRVEYLSKLLAALRETQAKAFEITEEIQHVLGGGQALGPQLKELESLYAMLWGQRYGNTPYAWNYARDRMQMKRLLKLLGPVELEARMNTYIRNTDPFFTKGKHSFGLFVATINQHATEDTTSVFALDADARPVGCSHEPPCQSDVTHTQRMVRDRHA